ncbi:MAG: hypothetical protein JSR67_09310 [Proteobacteria bacterium]|nr:hypothetical protein [Pseudomonadota bacterium]
MKSPIHPPLLAIALLGMAGTAFAGGFPQGTYSAGEKVTMTFDANGQFQVHQGHDLMVTGSYAVRKNRLELTDTAGPWACTRPAERTGSYTWKYADSVLTLMKASDGCQDRVGSLVRSTWKKTGAVNP